MLLGMDYLITLSTARMPRHKIQRLQTCKKSHATHQVAVQWRGMIIPFRTPQFSFFYDEKYKLKLKLKQASKEFQKELHCEKTEARLAKMFFTFVSRFHKVCGDLKRVQNEILFLVIKYVLNKINLTRHSTKFNIMLFFVAFLN